MWLLVFTLLITTPAGTEQRPSHPSIEFPSEAACRQAEKDRNASLENLYRYDKTHKVVASCRPK